MMIVLLTLAVLTVCCSSAVDLCERCECLPTQAICRQNDAAHKTFYPTTTGHIKNTLELVYIYDIETVNFEENSFQTAKPVTILIQNCTNVNIANGSIDQLRTLVIRDTVKVRLGMLDRNVLWAVLLENIEHLTIDVNSLSANYSVSLGHIDSLNIEQTQVDYICSDNVEFTFNMYDCKVNAIYERGMFLCGGYITLDGNTFEFIDEEGLQIFTEGTIGIINNHFKRLKKESFNLTAPEIHISGNRFDQLPAGTLRAVSTMQDTFFRDNIIQDIDLGGVLLDMGWEMVVENNIIHCDCASKRTSILNPKEDMLVLTNSSYEKLHNIFMNNYCNLNCSVSLAMFSYALGQATVCITNSTQLEQQLLCNITIETTTMEPEYTTGTSEEPFSTTNSLSGNDSFVFSSATKAEFLIPLIIIVLTLLVTSSVCYLCCEMNTFKFTFSPNTLAKYNGPYE